MRGEYRLNSWTGSICVPCAQNNRYHRFCPGHGPVKISEVGVDPKHPRQKIIVCHGVSVTPCLHLHLRNRQQTSHPHYPLKVKTTGIPSYRLC